MNNFLNWFQEHRLVIAWFIIGFLTAQGCEQLKQADYTSALVSFAIVALNYYTRK